MLNATVLKRILVNLSLAEESPHTPSKMSHVLENFENLLNCERISVTN